MEIQKQDKKSKAEAMTDKTSLLNTEIWGCEGFEPQPVVETLWPILAKLNPKPITTDLGEDITDLQEMRVPIMQGCELFFSTDKIEKLHIAIVVIMKNINSAWVEVTPNDDYDFPIFELDLFEYSDKAFFLLDMHPLRDLVIDAWYREKYLDPVEPIWKEYPDLNTGKSVTASALSSFLSPYSIIGIHKPADDMRSNMARMLECATKYLEYYVDNVVAKAEPVEDPERKAFVIKKKQAMRAYYRTKDPTVAQMSKQLGFDLLKKSWYHSFF